MQRNSKSKIERAKKSKSNKNNGPTCSNDGERGARGPIHYLSQTMSVDDDYQRAAPRSQAECRPCRAVGRCAKSEIIIVKFTNEMEGEREKSSHVPPKMAKTMLLGSIKEVTRAHNNNTNKIANRSPDQPTDHGCYVPFNKR